MGKVDFTWFEQIVTELGLQLNAATVDERVATAMTAGHHWFVTATRERSSEGPDDFRTVFSAPHSGVPSFDANAMQRGESPVSVSIRRDDTSMVSLGGGAGDMLVVGAISMFRRHRKDTRTAPRDRVMASISPDGLVPQYVIDRIAGWPGDAAYGFDLDTPPASTALARTPEGGLAITIDLNPAIPLTMRTNSFGDRDQFRHAVETWAQLVAAINAAGVLVFRDQASFGAPSNQDVAAMAKIATEQLRALKAQQRAQRRNRSR